MKNKFIYLLSLAVMLSIITVACAKPLLTEKQSTKFTSPTKNETLSEKVVSNNDNSLKVLGMMPQDDEVNMRAKSFIVIIFNKELLLKDSELISVTSNGTVIETMKAVEGNKLLIDPTTSLGSSASYKVTVKRESVSSKANEYLEQDYENFFTTELLRDLNLTAVRVLPESPGTMSNDSEPIQVLFNKNVVIGKHFSDIRGTINDEIVEVESTVHGMSMEIKIKAKEQQEGELRIEIPEGAIQGLIGEDFNEKIDLQYVLNSNLSIARSNVNTISTIDEIDRSYYHKKISAGTNHSLIINANKQVLEWKNNNSLYDELPTLIEPLANKEIISVSAGESHSLALASDGTVWAWGDNTQGQLGNGTYESRNTPVQVVGENGEGFLNNIVSISAGWDHNLAVTSDGNVFAWGLNEDGQLGDGGNNWVDSPVPVLVLAAENEGETYLEDVIYADAGAYHSVALKADGTAYFWGNQWKIFGMQIDLPTFIPRLIETDMYNNPIINVKDIQATALNTIILLEDGRMIAKGVNGSGELGNGEGYLVVLEYIYADYETGKVLENIKSFDVAVGRRFSDYAIYISAIDTGGSLYSWGGGLGVPRLVTDGKFTSIGNSHLGGMSFKPDGSLIAWEYNRTSDSFDIRKIGSYKDIRNYEYSPAGLLMKEIISIRGKKYEVSYSYDPNGNMLSKKLTQIE
ncbi:MAG: Ig-like domain-containing protein [Candidatus Pristimantibacillus lignocellulolyticus]|uniref:Ig-like domain-containing protein n=1 Tax=Candidatus Pristimantibacillus lignocellulolyticus TaxID=2994561 RepID=A0A9J6ZG34_9BACL|nr:MAG: Ig-like domain-containing protein [Candidatus Pristimantibacillus lignocellulolyticus]